MGNSSRNFLQSRAPPSTTTGKARGSLGEAKGANIFGICGELFRILHPAHLPGRLLSSPSGPEGTIERRINHFRGRGSRNSSNPQRVESRGRQSRNLRMLQVCQLKGPVRGSQRTLLRRSDAPLPEKVSTQPNSAENVQPATRSRAQSSTSSGDCNLSSRSSRRPTLGDATLVSLSSSMIPRRGRHSTCSGSMAPMSSWPTCGAWTHHVLAV